MTMDAETPWLAGRARRQGGDEAIRCGMDRFTWLQLASQADAIACRLAGLGVARGDIVALRMTPHPRVAVFLHALQSLGAAMLPLNLRLAGPELQRILAHARPRLLVDDAPESTPAADAAGMRRVHPFEDFDDREAPKTWTPPDRIDPHAALTIVYTSGTTAAPKGVVLTNANHAASASASRLRLGHGRADTWLATLPLFHVGGLAILARSVLEGSRVILEPSFDEGRACDVLAGGEATMISMVPTMLVRVLERMSGAVSPRVRAVLVGGAALAPSLGRNALDAGLPVAATYGLTEACSQVCTTSPGSDEAARGLVGRPLDGTQIRIDDADGGGWGEILVRGPTVMRGYLRNPDAGAVALRGGWLHTGDIGRIDGHGSLAVAGRRDDLIVTGGENVSPDEVERVLDAHPGVLETLVFGADDAQWGQRVVALVVVRQPDGPQAEDLAAWCRIRLAPYKIPREFRFPDALPRSETGKLLRREAGRVR